MMISTTRMRLYAAEICSYASEYGLSFEEAEQKLVNAELDRLATIEATKIAARKHKLKPVFEFDNTAENYPRELDIALQAWRAVSNTQGKQTPKVRLIEWVSKNYPDVRPEARERIATVANWKKGGASTATCK